MRHGNTWRQLGGVRLRPASDGRVLSAAFLTGIEGGILIVLASRPGILPVLVLGAVVVAHALMSFATEDPRERSD